MLAAMTVGGCDDAPKPDLPPVPAQLVASDELPFGDRVNAKLTRASNTARDRMERRWGPLDARVYLLPREQAQAFLAGLSAPPSSGWTVESAPERLPDGSLLAVYVRDGRVLAYLVLDQVQGDQLPVQRLYNEAKGGH
jgi:hypothetical protein